MARVQTGDHTESECHRRAPPRGDIKAEMEVARRREWGECPGQRGGGQDGTPDRGSGGDGQGQLEVHATAGLLTQDSSSCSCCLSLVLIIAPFYSQKGPGLGSEIWAGQV